MAEKTQIPSIGRIVLYTLTKPDAMAINRRREHVQQSSLHRATLGVQLHVGEAVEVGDEVPMIITKVFQGHCEQYKDEVLLINGKCLLDGTDDYWATSVPEGPHGVRREGCWRWPPRI